MNMANYPQQGNTTTNNLCPRCGYSLNNLQNAMPDNVSFICPN